MVKSKSSTKAKASSSASASSSKSKSPKASTSIEESVLKDVLEQLEKERIKRAEVEAELFNLRKKVDESTDASVAAASQEASSSSTSTSLSPSSPTTKCRLDDADRIHKVNNYLAELNSIDDNKKPSKRNLSLILNKLFTELQDIMMEDVKAKSKVNQKSRKELRVKDEVSKIMSEYNKKVPGLVWKYDETTLLPILHTSTSEFIASLDRLSGSEKIKEMDSQMEKMRTELITLRTEKDGYLKIIDALTPNNNAMLLSCKDESNKKTLPLETVQALELTPWEERVKSYTKDCDIVHQWQIYDLKAKNWVDRINLFPNAFTSASLPASKSDSSSSSSSSSSNTSSSSLSQKSSEKGRFLDLSDGYPLPSRGTWEWIGGWKIEGVPHSNSDTTDEGWKYAEKLQDLKNNITDKCYDEAGEATEKQSTIGMGMGSPILFARKDQVIPLRKYRRRIWKRQRVLTSYPGISRGTSQVLSLFVENAKLSLTVTKLHDQVFRMQNQLTQKEQDLDKTTMELMSQLSVLELENDKNSNELSKKSKEYNELKLKNKVKDKQPSQAGKKTKTSTSKNVSPGITWRTKEISISPNDSRSPISSLFSFSGSDTDVEKKLVVGETIHEEEKTKTEDCDSGAEKSTKEETMTVLRKEKDSKSSPIKSRPPLIALRDVTVVTAPCTKENIPDEIKKDSQLQETESEEDTDEDDITIFRKEDFDTPQKEKNGAPKKSKEAGVGSNSDTKGRIITDPFDWRKINRVSIINTVKSKVKDVETNVHNVKNNVQAIAEKAHSFQKMAHQVR